MCTTSRCCTGTQVLQAVTGALVLASLAGLAWVILTHSTSPTVDPLTEADRRINELEDSLQRIQNSIGQAVG